MTTVAPPRPLIDDLERLATDSSPTVCHLRDEAGVLCGAVFSDALSVESAEPNPAASPCAGGCGRDRCASCAAEYTIRMAA